ncbi:MAG: HEAT repeat domain-containing protein, partial [Lacipirellulaceae bacterium]
RRTSSSKPLESERKLPNLVGGICLLALASTALALFTATTGCSSWPFRQKERTSLITPGMRMAAIREIGPRASKVDAEQQKEYCEQLAIQIQTEPDPIVRRTIQETIAEFDQPLAEQVLLAGLNDDDLDVRRACCRKLGERGKPAAIEALGRIVAEAEEVDLKLAAVDALGKIKSPESVAALSKALENRDPAMQYAGVQALQQVSDESVSKELGNDVTAWRQYAQTKVGGTDASSIATQPTERKVY